MTDEEFKKLVEEYENELKALDEMRLEKAKKRATMTQEEILDDYVKDLQAVYDDAIKNGVDIVYVGEKED